MKHRRLIVATLVTLLILFFASCNFTTNRNADQPLNGRMLLWHSLNASETEALNQVINSFTELNPDVSVKTQAFPTSADLNAQFISAAATGLGPDMILAPSAWVQPFVASRLISPIDDHLDENIVARFNASILAMLQIDGQTYGLPQSLNTLALYVNNQVVETPATTFSALLEEANAGTTVLLPINFTDAFWGIQAFGGRLFDDEGQTILDQGGFANWLAWLRDARNAPGMIQDTNRDVLRQRFVAGDAGYYVGYASELNEILPTQTPYTTTVLPLPTGPVGPAGPFVTSQAFLFSSVSSQNQRLLAVELAKFVTNNEQSSRLMRLVRHVPANINVRINPRLYPIVASFAGQARNAIPMPTRAEFAAVLRLGNEAYIRALEGGESPAEVAFAVNNTINEANGFAVQSEPRYACNGLGTIALVHTWQQADDIATLDQIIERFRDLCPLIIVETQLLTEQAYAEQFTATGESGFRPTFGLANQAQLAQLVASLGVTTQTATAPTVVMNLNSLLASETLQRFSPIGIEAMRVQGNLYGLPLALEVDALYYNRQLVTTPALTLDDLRSQAMSGIPITLDTRFEEAFWGMRAFGTELFAPSGASLLDHGGMADWLLWLRESRDNFGVQLSTDGDELLRRFLVGESAYLVAGPNELATLQEALGDNLGIALLPSGPAGPAQPLVNAEGFVLREGVTEAAQTLALEFMRYATDIESQTRLMNEAQKIPANANVGATAAEDTTNSASAVTRNAPYFAIFIEQVQSGFLLPNDPTWQPVVTLGQAAYADVLNEGQEPNTVVAELTAAINRANGIVVTPTPTAPPPSSDILREDTSTPAPTTDLPEGDATPVSPEETPQP